MTGSVAKPLIGAVILAAGLSRRMGKAKLTLPWFGSSVIETVVNTVVEAGVTPVHVVAGGYYDEIQRLLSCKPVSIILNPEFSAGEMISSVKIGLTSLRSFVDASMLVLGDQPQIQAETVRNIKKTFEEDLPEILIPSYQNRRGHPIVIREKYFDEIITLAPRIALKDWIKSKQNLIRHFETNDPAILLDLDTPEDYERYAQEMGKKG